MTDLEELSPQGQRFLSVIVRSAERELRLVDDLLTLVAIEESGLAIRTAEIDLERVVRDAVEAGRPRAEEGQLSLSLALVFSAGLFVRSALKAGRVDEVAGFQGAGVVLAEIDYSLANTPPAEARRRSLAVLERVRALPGVTAAGLSTLVPYNNQIAVARLVPAGVAIPPPGSSPARSSGRSPRGRRPWVAGSPVPRAPLTWRGSTSRWVSEPSGAPPSV
jgi:hypothetical protein